MAILSRSEKKQLTPELYNTIQKMSTRNKRKFQAVRSLNTNNPLELLLVYKYYRQLQGQTFNTLRIFFNISDATYV